MVHKPKAMATSQIYVLDSCNILHMDREDEDLEHLSVESRCWKKIRLGLKPASRFGVQMSIQSLFDQRTFYEKIDQIFNDGLTIPMLLIDCQINYMLRGFH